jgi:hypothetical protein
LGEFSSNGRIFTWGSFQVITEIAHNFRLLFPKYRLCINFDKKWVGQHFERFFHKLIWSPCLMPTDCSVINWSNLVLARRRGLVLTIEIIHTPGSGIELFFRRAERETLSAVDLPHYRLLQWYMHILWGCLTNFTAIRYILRQFGILFLFWYAVP